MTQWSSGLLSCTIDTGLCIDMMCCHCCIVGRSCAAAEGNKDTLSIMHCCLDLCFPNCVQCCLRRKVAERFGLDEGCCGAFLKAFCCYCCSGCQVHRELTARDFWPGGACCHKSPTDINLIK